MRHLDLFSGIGGFAIAVNAVWPGAEHIFCEIDPYCKALLKKRFEGSVIYSDIRTLRREGFVAEASADAFRSKCGGEDNGRVQDERRTTSKDRREGIQSENRQTRSDNAQSGSIAITNADKRKGRSGDESKPSKPAHAKLGAENRIATNKDTNIDILTGGFPCQPFSQAGKRRGTDDDRFLWPEMLRVIKEFRPTWIIGENVAGILTVVEPDGSTGVAMQDDLFSGKNDETRDYNTVPGRIERELREIGYETLWFVIPACAVGAPHRRDRVWIIGHSNSSPSNSLGGFREGKGSKPPGSDSETEQERSGRLDRSVEGDSDARKRDRVWIIAHAGHRNGQGSEKHGKLKGQISQKENASQYQRSNSNARKAVNIDTAGNRCDLRKCDRQGRQIQDVGKRKIKENKQERSGRKHRIGERDSDVANSKGRSNRRHEREVSTQRQPSCGSTSWERNWLEIATELCGVDDGLSAGVDGLKLSASKHRVERLKGLGNAIVPAVAIEIMRAIKEAEE